MSWLFYLSGEIEAPCIARVASGPSSCRWQDEGWLNLCMLAHFLGLCRSGPGGLRQQGQGLSVYRDEWQVICDHPAARQGTDPRWDEMGRAIRPALLALFQSSRVCKYNFFCEGQYLIYLNCQFLIFYQQFNPFGLHLLLSWVSEFYRMTFLNLLRDTVKLWKFFCSLNLFFDIDQVDPWINMIPSGHRGKIICCFSLHASLKKTSLIS